MGIINLLKEEKDYRKLFLAGVVNGIGDRFSQVAMLALLIKMTGSGMAVGLAMAMRLVPFLFFGPVGGHLADRLPKRTVMITTDMLRIFFAMSFIFVNSSSDVWMIYASSFMLALGEAVYIPSRKSLIPSLTMKRNLVKINSLEQVLLGIVLIAGSFSGGIVTYFFGPDMTFVINGFSFCIAACILYFLPRKERIEKGESPADKLGQSSLSIRKILFASSSLLIVILLECLIPLFSGIDNVLISVYAVEEFKLGDLGVGLFYGSLGIGLVLSFAFSCRLKKHLVTAGLLALTAEGLLLMVLSQVYFYQAAILIYISIAFLSGIGNTCFDTVVMKETPAEYQGKIFGMLATISNTFIGLSMVGTGALLGFMENRLVGLLGGAAFVFIGLMLIGIFYRSGRSDRVNSVQKTG